MWLRAQCLLVNVVTAAVGRISTPRLLQLVSRIKVRDRRDANLSAEQLEDTFADTVVWLPLSRTNTCLPRAAALTWVLRRHGYPARMAVGYRPSPFDAHAWVELGERVIGDHPGYRRRFLSLGTW
jgi:hypothetical protein